MYNNVCILNFSDRNNGNCANICSFIENYHANTNICVFYVSKYFEPCGNCDYECLKQEEVCPNLTDLQRELFACVANSDISYYVVPNFCGFPCASYFAFNERSVGYFNMDREVMRRYMSSNKKFILVSNTESSVFASAMAQQAKEPDILYLKTGRYGKHSIAGDMLNSDSARDDLLQFLSKNHSAST